MLDGKKTFVIALVMIVLSSVLLYTKSIDADAYMKILGFVSAMVGARELGDKLLKKDSK